MILFFRKEIIFPLCSFIWQEKCWRLSLWVCLPRIDGAVILDLTYDFPMFLCTPSPLFFYQRISWQLCKNWLCAVAEAGFVSFFQKDQMAQENSLLNRFPPCKSCLLSYELLMVVPAPVHSIVKLLALKSYTGTLKSIYLIHKKKLYTNKKLFKLQ